MDLRPASGKGAESIRLATGAGNFWEGAVRSSKTICSILRWLEFLRQGPLGDVAMIGKTERTLKRNVLDVIVSMIGKQRAKVVMGAGEAEILGRRCYLASAHDEKAVAKIQGMTLAAWYGDELPTWPESVFNIARTRLSIDGAQWFATGNPDSSNHYLKREWIDCARLHLQRDGSVIHRYGGDDVKDVHVFSFQIRDNPWLPEDFVRRLEREYAGIFYRRFILGEWCLAEGAVFAEWDEALNVLARDEMPAMGEFLAAGIDYGTRNPFAAGMLAIGPDVRRRGEHALYLTDEWRWDSRRKRRQLSDVEYSGHVKRWMAGIALPGIENAAMGVWPEMIAVDPSAASFRVQLYRDGMPSRGAANEVRDSLRVAASLIAARKLYVADTMTGLRAEIPSYVWDDKAAKRGAEEPLKVDDHSIDASLRYAPYTSRHLWWDRIFDTELIY